MANLALNDKAALIEGVKEFLRFVWFSLIGLVIAYLQSKFVNDNNFMVALIATGIIKSLDTYVHKNDGIAANGLAPSILQR
jgi:phosphate starvation-inducible membrane PsiE